MKPEPQIINWPEIIAISCAVGFGQFVAGELIEFVFVSFASSSAVYALSCLARGIVMAVGFTAIFKRLDVVKR